MRTYFECLPCFTKQAMTILEFISEELHEEFIRESMHMLGDVDYSLTPPELAKRMYETAYKYTGSTDFYKEKKRKSNEFVMRLYPELEKSVQESSDSFSTAVRYAIAGNIIDFGATHNFSMDVLQHELCDALASTEITEDEIEDLRSEIEKADRILYIGDNAGEIVFDKLLLNELPGEKVVFSVRGGPIINDALMEDAEEVGITDKVKVISSGVAIPGTCPKECSDEFRTCFDEADLIISKGQGNYETLNSVEKNIFFLLKIKCPVVAKSLNGEIGHCVCMRSPVYSRTAGQK